MTGPRRSFVRETPEQRRQELIQATLDVIGESGFQAATIRTIATRANVTLGLIRHYFSSKEDLISAAYQHHMEQMTNLALSAEEGDESPAEDHLAKVITASLSPPVLSQNNVTLWASFVAQIANEDKIRATHDKTYLQLRDALERLISAALKARGQKVSPQKARHLATVTNAMIDGLWLEGGASPQEFEPGELVGMALKNIGLILGLDLNEKGNGT